MLDLQHIVGAAHVREAGERDRIDGVPSRFVVSPGSVEEAAGVLRLARGATMAVSPVGGGSKLLWGNRPERVDVILSTVRLNRVLEHAAGDLVMRAEAGAKLADVQRVVARSDQRLALNPPESGATLGGIVATNASGPLRHRFGTARDLLIGITYILPDGTVARAGGRVVKNVAGYDLCKLFTGSLGSLGLLVETIFRLHPHPAASRTVIVSRLSRPEDVGVAVQTVLHSSLVPNALDFNWGEAGELRVLFEGFEPGVVAQVKTATGVLAGFGKVYVEDTDPRELEGMTAEPTTEGEQEPTRLKISAPLVALPDVVRAVQSVAGGLDRHRTRGHAGAGITLVDLTGETEVVVDAVETLRGTLAPFGCSVVVQQAPASVKDALDVWGPIGDALPLMRRVKQMFDPTGIMNPGRFAGGL